MIDEREIMLFIDTDDGSSVVNCASPKFMLKNAYAFNLRLSIIVILQMNSTWNWHRVCSCSLLKYHSPLYLNTCNLVIQRCVVYFLGLD
jgi:hypothetical protein